MITVWWVMLAVGLVVGAVMMVYLWGQVQR